MEQHFAARGIRELRHARTVRITHWVNFLSFVALTVSGIGILTAHPRFYWGETGFFDTPAAFELPFEAILEDLYIRAWGRQVHFMAAWAAVLNGVVYVAWGLATGHFRFRFVPGREQLAWNSIKAVVGRHLRLQNPAEESGYNVLQKFAYSAVVFGLLPLVILSGLTMSPGVTAAFPQLFTLFGGRQSARTIHFILAVVLVLFGAMHVFMTFLAGFRRSVGAMISPNISRAAVRGWGSRHKGG
jgi:thiosulfate reductase cytochrome b subunit